MSDSGLGPSGGDYPEGGKKASFAAGGHAYIPDNTEGNYNVTSSTEATAAGREFPISSPVQETNPPSHGDQGSLSRSRQGDIASGQAWRGQGEAGDGSQQRKETVQEREIISVHLERSSRQSMQREETPGQERQNQPQTLRKQLEAAPRHEDQVAGSSSETSSLNSRPQPSSNLHQISSTPNLQLGHHSRDRPTSATSLPGSIPSATEAGRYRTPQRQVSLPIGSLVHPRQTLLLQDSPLIPSSVTGPSIASQYTQGQHGIAGTIEPLEPTQLQQQPSFPPGPYGPERRDIANSPPGPYGQERSNLTNFPLFMHQPSPLAGNSQPSFPVVTNPQVRPPPEGRSGAGHTGERSRVNVRAVAHTPNQQPTADSCRTCIGILLDNTGQSDEVMRKKRNILFNLLPNSSPFPAKTIVGLARRLLPLSSEELDFLIDHPPITSHLRTCVHVAVRDMRSEGRKLGHLVEYFMADYSKRVDIVRRVLERSIILCSRRRNYQVCSEK